MGYPLSLNARSFQRLQLSSLIALFFLQEVAETLEKRGLKEEAIEFYNQVPKAVHLLAGI